MAESGLLAAPLVIPVTGTHTVASPVVVAGIHAASDLVTGLLDLRELALDSFEGGKDEPRKPNKTVQRNSGCPRQVYDRILFHFGVTGPELLTLALRSPGAGGLGFESQRPAANAGGPAIRARSRRGRFPRR